MTTIIDPIGQPTLWNSLNSIHADDPEKGWILYDGVTYQAKYKTDNTKIFVGYENKELYDSRSIRPSKPAKYTKLDNG